MSKIEVEINDKKVLVDDGISVLEACKQAGIDIPTLCYLKSLGALSKCRVCIADVNGRLITACSSIVFPGAKILTSTQRVLDARKFNIELLLSNHNYDCDNCIRNNNCELQSVAKEYGADANHFAGVKLETKIDDSSPAFYRDNSKCIACGRCTATCKNKQSVSVITNFGRGFDTQVGYPFGEDVILSNCVNCGQCVVNCPTGALSEKDDTEIVEKALKNKKLHLVVATAPSVRVGLGEEFGLPVGSNVEKKMVTALKQLGFKHVFDINFAADLTVTEEAHEFVERLNSNTKLPMFTSCCPGWMEFVKNFFPEYLDNTSSCKSPQGMFGSACKSYFADNKKLKPENVFVVTIMPCTAKKTERLRGNINVSKGTDVDAALTVRELARLLKKYNIDLPSLPESEFDKTLGMSSGAGVIFGNTGGVMEAALRTVADTVENKEIAKVDYQLVRGLSGIKEASIHIKGRTINLAIASGLSNARKLILQIKNGERKYDFVEVMACPGGCVYGGGMPIKSSSILNSVNVAELRAEGLYSTDLARNYRKAHKNPEIIDAYKAYFGKPGSKKAHKLLHVDQKNMLKTEAKNKSPKNK